MSKTLGFFDLKLSEKIGKVFEHAVYTKNYDVQDFIDKWLISDTYKAILSWDVSIVSQCATYILDCFEVEMEQKGMLVKTTQEIMISGSCVYWIGYILTYWCIRDGITGGHIKEEYQTEVLIGNAEVYHSMSVATAISMIDEDAKRGN